MSGERAAVWRACFVMKRGKKKSYNRRYLDMADCCLFAVAPDAHKLCGKHLVTEKTALNVIDTGGGRGGCRIPFFWGWL